MRALLDLLREIKSAEQDQLGRCQRLLGGASLRLKILDPGYGEEELIKSVAAEMANLGEMAGKAELQQRPGDA